MNIEDIHDYFRENSVESFIQENLYNDYELELKQDQVIHEITELSKYIHTNTPDILQSLSYCIDMPYFLA